MAGMTKAVCVGVLLLLLFAGTAMAGQKRIAVLEFHNFAELKQQEAAYITEVMRREALKLPVERYFVMTRENIMQLLPPGTNLAKCEGDCEVETGRKVGADYVVSGEILTFGTKLKVNMKIHDTATNALLSSQVATAPGVDELEAPLAAAARTLYDHLPGLRRDRVTGGSVTMTEYGKAADGGKDIVNPIVDETGYLFVDSEPKGATVLVNGEEKGTAPIQLELMKGEYVVVCSKGALYLPARKRIRMDQKGKRLKMALEPNFGLLRVSSEPSGAAIELNGEPTGKKTPYTFPPKPSGKYVVKLSKALHLSRQAEVELGQGKETPLLLELEPNFGAIEVGSRPQGADVYLDGTQVKGKTPLKLEPVAAGLHQVELRSAQYHSDSKRVTVKRGKVARVDLELTGKYGLLVVTAAVVDEGRSEPAQAQVWVNGQQMSTPAPFKDQFLVGEYKVEVRTDKAKGYEARVSIEEGKKTHVKAKMQKLLPAEVLARRRAEEQDRLDRQRKEREAVWQAEVGRLAPSRTKYHWAGGLLIVGGVSVAVTGIALWAKPMKDALGSRDDYYEQWRQATTFEQVETLEQQIRDEDDKAKTYNIAGWVGLGVGVAAIAGGIITLIYAPRLPDREKYMEVKGPELRAYAAPDGGGVVMGWRW